MASKRLSCILVAAALLAAAAEADAQVPGADYSGTTSAGGDVFVTVRPGGEAVEFYALEAPTACGLAEVTEVVPLVGGAFSDGRLPGAPGAHYTGSFAGTGVAGVLWIVTADPCVSPQVSWSASLDQAIDDSDGSEPGAAEAVAELKQRIARCRRLESAAKRRRCWRKARRKAPKIGVSGP